ncbi:MAG: hypothetical protein QMB93_01700 [Schleiferiaceae bacterium]|jgi:hypothetical protein|tara:strand:- start:12919 stop:14616 length:1698 start_codon:yes stop_codon:yes gene_type:complete
MKAALVFLLSICSIVGQSQPNKIDSLANVVNNEHREFKRSVYVEQALQYLAENDYEIAYFKSQLDVTKLTTRELLNLNAYEVKRDVRNGTYVYDSNDTDNNPYILYYRSIYFFQQGMVELAVRDLNLIAKEFILLSDSSFSSSVYNNLGATHWSRGNLDSALISFQKCRAYSSWYIEMLEANILGLANTINDIELSIEQIEIITKKNPNCVNPVYLNNLFTFVEKNDTSKADSVGLIIQNAYPNISELPEALLNLYTSNDWQISETIQKLMSMPSASPYFDLAVTGLLKNENILNVEVTDSTLHILYNKVEDEQLRSLIQLYFNTNTEGRKSILNYVTSPMNDSAYQESLDRLKKLTQQYREEKLISKKVQEKIIYLFILALLLILIAIVFTQRAKIMESKKVVVLTAENTSLETVKLELSEELIQLRKSLTSIARENIRKLEQLRILMTDLDDTVDSHDEKFKDLNIIRTHQEGITRFKISKFCEDLNTDSFKPLEKLISKKELQLLKLIALEFRSKEIAILLNVSPQYINNQRHKIKVLLNLQGYDFDKLLSNLKTDLFKQRA